VDLTSAEHPPTHTLEVTAMHRSRPLTAALTGAVVTAVHLPTVLVVVAVMIVLLYLGVILPAVWSTEAARRRDARQVLRLLIDCLRLPRSP
jgi:type II secretory pathway component PulF